MTLFYPDVSNNNWRSVADLTGFLAQLHKLGFSGVVHKVSEGDYFVDQYWQACRSWCESNDLSWLGYHYVTTDDADSQVDTFIANRGGPNVMLDFEDHSGDIDNLWDVVAAFNDARVNVCQVYLPEWYWQDIGEPDLSDFEANDLQLVSSNYPAGSGYAWSVYAAAGGDSGPGWHGYGGATPAAWQFSDSVNVAGIMVDCNAYKGSNLDGFFTY